jgi:hypothetical protein
MKEQMNEGMKKERKEERKPVRKNSKLLPSGLHTKVKTTERDPRWQLGYNSIWRELRAGNKAARRIKTLTP